MSSRRIGTRGILVSFDDPYRNNVYIILGNEHLFVLDTFLGNNVVTKEKEFSLWRKYLA